MIILIGVDMKTRVALCANKNIGLKITQFLKNHEDTEICLLYLTGEDKAHDSRIIKSSGVKSKNIFRGNEVYKTKKHTNFFKKKKIDFLITVYWPWILKESFFQLAKQTINFHPSLLPMNRGWYPHVHNIIKNTKSGVTLHKISKKSARFFPSFFKFSQPSKGGDPNIDMDIMRILSRSKDLTDRFSVKFRTVFLF